MEKATNSKVGRYVVLSICALALAGAGSFDGQPTPRSFAAPTPRAVAPALVPIESPSPPRLQAARGPGDLQAYAEIIPGTTVAFDMIPVPGGSVTIADPAADGGERVVEVAFRVLEAAEGRRQHPELPRDGPVAGRGYHDDVALGVGKEHLV